MEKSKQILIALGAIAVVGAVIIIKGKKDKNALRRFSDGKKVNVNVSEVITGVVVYKSKANGKFYVVKIEDLDSEKSTELQYVELDSSGKIVPKELHDNKGIFLDTMENVSDGKTLFTTSEANCIYYKEK